MGHGKQVRSLLQLYVDIEHTGRNAAFYEKFNTRYVVGGMLSAALFDCCSVADLSRERCQETWRQLPHIKMVSKRPTQGSRHNNKRPTQGSRHNNKRPTQGSRHNN